MRSEVQPTRTLAVRAAISVLRIYQAALSPLFTRLGSHCRFHPTCSEYAVQAINRYGVRAGVAKAWDRLRRCRPDNLDSCIDFP